MSDAIFTFDDAEAAVQALERLRQLGVHSHEVMSPVPDYRLEEAERVGSSRTGPVHWFSLVGAVVGCALGWTLTIATSLDYPVNVAGRGVVVPHVYFIIAYELTLLTAIVMTMIGFLSIARLPQKRDAYHVAASWDKVVVVVDSSDPVVHEAIEQCGGVRSS
jgi:hypothetical protein